MEENPISLARNEYYGGKKRKNQAYNQIVIENHELF